MQSLIHHIERKFYALQLCLTKFLARIYNFFIKHGESWKNTKIDIYKVFSQYSPCKKRAVGEKTPDKSTFSNNFPLGSYPLSELLRGSSIQNPCFSYKVGIYFQRFFLQGDPHKSTLSTIFCLGSYPLSLLLRGWSAQKPCFSCKIFIYL